MSFFSRSVIDGDAKVVSFCFGQSNSGGWFPFTLFILLETGETFYISPVIPYDCALRFQLLKDLEDDAEDALHRLERAPREVQPYEFEALDLQKQWLCEVAGEVVALSATDPGDFVIQQDPDVSDTDSDTSSSSRRGSRSRNRPLFSAAKRAAEWVRTRRPETLPATRLQGPIHFVRDGDPTKVKDEVRLSDNMGHASDFVITASSPPVIVRAFGRGAIECSTICDQYQPLWKQADAGLPVPPLAIFWEGLDLQYHQDQAPLPNMPFTPVKLMVYPQHDSLVYIYSSHTVHRLDLVWIPRLQSALSRDASSPKEAIANLPHSEADTMLSLREIRSSLPSAVLGTCFLAQPSTSSIIELLLVLVESADSVDAEGGSISSAPTTPKSPSGLSVSPNRFEAEAKQKKVPARSRDESSQNPSLRYNPNQFSWKLHCLEARRPTAAKDEWMASGSQIREFELWTPSKEYVPRF